MSVALDLDFLGKMLRSAWQASRAGPGGTIEVLYARHRLPGGRPPTHDVFAKISLRSKCPE
jgi:hypothetical protein